MPVFTPRSVGFTLNNTADRIFVGQNGPDPGDEPWMFNRTVWISNTSLSTVTFDTFMLKDGGFESIRIASMRVAAGTISLNFRQTKTAPLVATPTNQSFGIRRLGPIGNSAPPPSCWASFAGASG